MDVILEGRLTKALVDTGCSKTIVTSRLAGFGGSRSSVIAVDGSRVQCLGQATVSLVVVGEILRVSCIVAKRLLDEVDVILGMDVIERLGGVTVRGGKVRFFCGAGKDDLELEEAAAPALQSDSVEVKEAPVIEIDDKDFMARFDGKKWTVKWVWKDGAPALRNRVSCYDSARRPEIQESFDGEVTRWIEEGWLIEWKGPVDGVIPLMAVVQPTKGKVRPVLDYRELNDFVESHTGDEIVVCDETLRKWRRLHGNLKLVDLRSAYLQIHVDESLWPYQLIRYKDKTYCLTRLGFGLNCAPRILMRILREVLESDERIYRATDHYLDDIIVQDDIVPAEEVVQHLKNFGLEAKPPQALEDGAVLGLKIARNSKGDVVFRRGNTIPSISHDVSRRELFAICGKLIGHYPVAGWIRVACSFLKRVSLGTTWESSIGDIARSLL